MGPSPYPSTFGHRYYIIFVDTYTRFTWLCPLKHKSQVLHTFIDLKRNIELQLNSKIKALHSDMRGEYISFSSYLKQEDI